MPSFLLDRLFGSRRLTSTHCSRAFPDIAVAWTATAPPIPVTLSPEALSLSACSVSRVASQTGRPAARKRAAISPPNAPIPTIKVFMLLSELPPDPKDLLHRTLTESASQEQGVIAVVYRSG